MAAAFDPYYHWLGIPPKDQPANHYRLLGLQQFESKLDVIENAVDRQMAHVRGFQSGQHAEHSQRLLNEISAAKVCLLKPEEKAAYDLRLKKQLAAGGQKKAKPLAVAKPLDENAPQPATTKPSIPAPQPTVAIDTRTSASKTVSAGPPLVLIAAVGGAVAGLLLLVFGATLLFWLAQDAPRPPVSVVERPPSERIEDEAPIVPRVDVPPVRNNPGRNPPATDPPDRDPPPRVDNPPITNPPFVEPTQNSPPNSHLLALLDVEPETAETRSALPTPEEQAAKTRQIEEIFSLGDAQTFQERVALAKKLLQTGKESTGDAVAQYVLFEMARNVSAEAGDASVALDAVDALDAQFQVAGAKLRAETIATAAKASPPPAVKKATIERGIELIDQLYGDGDFAEAGRLVSGLTVIARSLRDGDLVARLVELREVGREMYPAYQAAQQAMEKFQDDPEDADAALAIGKFFALAQGDWQRGLPFLAAGSDDELKQLAEQEMAVTDETSARRKLADAWHAASESSEGIAADRQKARAAMWYQLIVDDVSGLTKVEIQRRLDELGSLTVDGGSPFVSASAATDLVNIPPPEVAIEEVNIAPPSQQAIDLFSRIDLPRDRLNGAWRMEDEQLVSPQTYGAMVKLPAEVPDEYQITLDVERKSGKNAFLVGLVSQGNQFQTLLGYDEPGPQWGHVSALEDVNGGRVTSTKNPTTTEGYPFDDEGVSTIVCTVRKDRINVSCDGKQIIDYQGDPSQLTMPTYWAAKLRGHNGLWVGSYACSFAISRIELTPLGGKSSPADSGSSVDLLALIDPAKDSTKGSWRKVSGKLHSPKMQFATLQIPYVPPEEYEIDAVVSCSERYLDFTMGLARDGRQFGVNVEGYLHTRQPHSGIDLVDQRQLSGGNVTAHRGPVAITGKENRLMFHVSKEKISFQCNDQEIFSFAGDSARLYKHGGLPVSDKQALFLAAYDRNLTIHSLTLTPISGRGRALRGVANEPTDAQSTVDLLALIDVDKNTFNGQWKREGGELVSPENSFSRVRIPYHPPRQYDLDVNVTRVSGNQDISIGLIYQGKQCHVALDRRGGTQSDLMVDMRTNADGVARFRGNAIGEGERGKVTCQVRNDHLTIKLNGEELFTYRGRPSWNGMNEFWRVGDEQALMIGSHKAVIRVHSITLTPVGDAAE